MIRIPSLILAAGLAVALVGCGGSNNGSGSSNTRNAYVTPFDPKTDVQYIDAIVPHHKHAVEMSTREIAVGSNPAVIALAQRFKDTQTQELTVLSNARRELTGQAETPAPPRDEHSMNDLATMNSITGTAADEFFLTHMIPHHAEGISIAHRAEKNVTRQDIKDNTQFVQASQGKEIGEMTTLLGRD